MRHNKNSSAAVVFLGIIWVVFLGLVAHSIYKDLMQITTPTIFKLKNMEELMNGNP
jgi:hypothetical protein